MDHKLLDAIHLFKLLFSLFDFCLYCSSPDSIILMSQLSQFE